MTSDGLISATPVSAPLTIRTGQVAVPGRRSVAAIVESRPAVEKPGYSDIPVRISSAVVQSLLKKSH